MSVGISGNDIVNAFEVVKDCLDTPKTSGTRVAVSSLPIPLMVSNNNTEKKFRLRAKAYRLSVTF